MAFEQLAVEHLAKNYGDVAALVDCDLTVAAGQMVGFLGPNGAGKTTTMRAVLGVITIDSGAVLWNGRPLSPDHRKRIGYLPQERGLYPRMKVHEQVAYFGRLAGLDRSVAAERATRWLERVELADRRDSLVQELSVGNQQRVQLAVALVHEPELLVLDEPFAGLDPVGVASMQEILRDRAEAGAGVVFSSHQLDLVQDLCRDVTIIAAGTTVATGTVEDLRAEAPSRHCTVVF
ncbi:MAG: ATP-binding cassette domain-containing protein, partial [Acidimicrobiales bacterium]|nr:ATP-binding cassette domain-containing protein [Acidimicrobiales bacterium]